MLFDSMEVIEGFKFNKIICILQTSINLLMEAQLKADIATKKSILFSNSSLTSIQLSELQKAIQDLVYQNRKKHALIVDSKPEFAYQLYKISEFQAISKAFGKELLLRQMDRLLEQKNYLDRELSLIRFKNEEDSNQHQQMMASETNHFELLKSIWKKDGNQKYEGVLEHMEELNLMVGQIKSNIQSLIKFQSNDSKDFEQTYLKTFQHLHDKNRECQKCHEHSAKVAYLTQKLQATEEKLSKLNDQNINYLQEINGKDDRLKKLTKNMLKQETDLKDRIIQLEQDLLKRDQLIKKMKRELADLNMNKFTNEEEGFELYIKTHSEDLSKYDRQTVASLDTLLRCISSGIVQKTLKVGSEKSVMSYESSQTYKSYVHEKSSESKKTSSDSIQDSPQIVANIIFASSHSDINKPSRIEKSKDDISKGYLGDNLKSKLEELEASNKRYIRTASKRGASRGNSSSQQDENGVSVSSFRVYKASPSSTNQ